MGDGELPSSVVHMLEAVDLPIALSQYGSDVTQVNGVTPDYIRTVRRWMMQRIREPHQEQPEPNPFPATSPRGSRSSSLQRPSDAKGCMQDSLPPSLHWSDGCRNDATCCLRGGLPGRVNTDSRLLMPLVDSLSPHVIPKAFS